MEPLQTRLRLLFTRSKEDVTQNLMPDLLSFEYRDKESAEADELSLTLKDPSGRWAEWQNAGGEVVRAYLAAGTTLMSEPELFCGTFFVDTRRVSGAPRTFEMTATSVPLNKDIRKKQKTRAWEKTSLKSIASTIANEASVGLLFDVQEDTKYDRVDQSKESDLALLLRLADEAGCSLKVTDEKIVIFDQAYYEKKEAVATVRLGTSAILSWEFESSQGDTYKSCKVSYRDPKQKKQQKAGGYDFYLRKIEKKSENPAVMSYTAVDPNVDATGQEYELKRRATSMAEAKRLATAKLRNLNRRSVIGSLTLVGDTTLVAGIVISCRGFGSFDGNFIIEEATHTLDGSGYRTALELRRVNNVY